MGQAATLGGGPAAPALAPTTMGGFLEQARQARDLAALTLAFGESIAPHGFTHHLCLALDGGEAQPLFGDAALVAGEPVVQLPVATWRGGGGVICLGGRMEPVGPALRASLAGRAEIHATFGVALLQRAGDIETAAGLGLAERQCLAGLLLGEGVASIARRLTLDPLAVTGHVERAIARLGVASRAEAVALAARRGLLATIPADYPRNFALNAVNYS